MSSITYFVGVYEVSRHFGGPEEGGWWYNARTLVAQSLASDEATADAIVVAWENGDYADQPAPYGDLNSVLYRGGCYEFRIDTQPLPAYETDYRPYE